MGKSKRQPTTHHIQVKEVKIPARRFPDELRFLIPVHHRNTPLFDYNRAKANINSDIKKLKRDIRRARLLKIQAYIAYRLTK